jgi:hypothetical protein
VKIACAVMQRDEDLVLDGWCRHHGALFGYENLFIFDNGSTNEIVVALLDKYKRLGCSIIKHYNKAQDFKDKGEILGKLFRRLQKYGGYDFMLPLDCDEFVSVVKDGKVYFGKEDVLEELGLYVECPDTIKIEYEFLNSLKYPGYFSRKLANKTVYAAPYFKEMDMGYHRQGTATGAFTHSSLTHIHLHNKPFQRTLEDAKRKLRGHGVNTNDLKVIENLTFSMHLKPYFKMTEQDFLDSYDDKCHVPIFEFPQWMLDLGVVSPLLTQTPNGKEPPIVFPADFDGAAYIAANADVAKAAMSADGHYSLFGFREGRKLRPQQATPAPTAAAVISGAEG